MAEPKNPSEYGVGVPQSSGTPAPASKRSPATPAQPRPDAPRAVFVAHGMGQQVRFATMDDFARGICEAADRHDDKITSRLARAVRAGCTTVRRIELEIEGKPAIHVYEGYWAPLTEGVVTLRDALRFLVGGGLNGIRSRGVLHRWLFGHPREFSIPAWDRISLWLALVAIFSIVVVGATILTVGTARLVLGRDDVSIELLKHLTGIFETLSTALVLSAVVAAAMVAIIRGFSAKKRRTRSDESVDAVQPRWAWILIIPAAFAGLAFILAALLIVLTVLHDVPPPFPEVCRNDAAGWCFDLFHEWVAPFLTHLYEFFCRIEAAIRWVLVAVILLGAAVTLWRMIAGGEDRHDARARATGGRVTTVILLVALAVFIYIVGCRPETIALITWIMLLALTAFVRRFLIQYAGDVAAYVCPHVVDRFFDLRERVKDTVWRAARAVYALRNEKDEWVYDSVLVAGHSLGSVIVYDVLNRLITEDEMCKGDTPEFCDGEPAEPLDVAKRTKFLLTYGSPLDKTAFVFATQAPATGSERDALIASGQPLIVSERKLQWRNIWSPFDIISGPLEFYDTPEDDDKNKNKNRVLNEVDPDANIFLAAHTQYGEGPLLFDRLYEQL